eukprot:Gb_16075 [translate_table: standard]
MRLQSQEESELDTTLASFFVLTAARVLRRGPMDGPRWWSYGPYTAVALTTDFFNQGLLSSYVANSDWLVQSSIFSSFASLNGGFIHSEQESWVFGVAVCRSGGPRFGVRNPIRVS